MLTQPTFLMRDYATIKAFLGTTPSGPSFGTAYTSQCRLESYKKRLVDANGKAFFSSAKVFLPPTPENLALERDSTLTIDSVKYKIIEKQVMKGFSVSHIECVVM